MAKAKIKKESTYMDAFNVKEALRYSSEPTRHYEIGDKVCIGSLKDVVITDIFEDGKVYKVDYNRVDNNYGNPIETKMSGYWMWYDIFPKKEQENHDIIKNEDIRLYYSCRTVGSLVHMVHQFGVDMNPVYQRGDVWDDKDKEALIDSIFHQVDIGKFTFIRNEYSHEGYGYEILDGKQRLTTLVDFYEGRFPYHGLYYQDMTNHEQCHFDDFQVNMAECSNLKETDKYRIFIILNTRGKAMEEKDLDKVRALYEEKRDDMEIEEDMER